MNKYTTYLNRRTRRKQRKLSVIIDIIKHVLLYIAIIAVVVMLLNLIVKVSEPKGYYIQNPDADASIYVDRKVIERISTRMDWRNEYVIYRNSNFTYHYCSFGN